MPGKKRSEYISSYYASKLSDPSLDDYAVLGWESREAQESRFQAFTDFANCRGKSVLDVGCGLGNLCGYLQKNNIRCDYTGIDIIDEMVRRASSRYDADFRCVDIFKENPFMKNGFDIIYASGIFNIQLGNNKDFLKQALEIFLETSREKVIFNLLHESSSDKENTYWYTSEDKVTHLLEQLSFRDFHVSFDHQYQNNDFTVCIEKISCCVLSS